MGLAVVTVASGGMPVVEVPNGTPVTEAINKFGLPVTKVVGKPGLPVTFETIGIVTGPTFDPATATSVTLSADGLTVTGTGTTSADQGARLANSEGKTAGKYYFEQTIVALTTSPNRGAGIGTTTSTYTGMGTSATVGVTMYPNSGGIWSNGSAVLGIAGRSVGDVIGYAVDLDNRKIWIRPNPGAIWNNNVANDPVTNVGGITIPAGTMVPFVTFGGTAGVAGSSFKANFGSTAFAGAVPAGFNPGWLQNFPSAATTGPAPGTVFTTTAGGELATTSNGQIIQNLNHAGYILIKHSNVTIRDCNISKPDNPNDVFAIGWDGISSPVTGLKVLRCRINGGFALGGIILDTLGSAEVGYCDISRVENGISISASNINIHDNYIHNLLREPGHVDPHFDCIQGFPGAFTNWSITRNTFETQDTSGMITSGTSAGSPNVGLTFSNNLLIPVAPVSYGIQVKFTSNVTVINNRFRRPTFPPGSTVYPLFPMDMISVTGLVHSGNVDDVTNAPLTPSIS